MMLKINTEDSLKLILLFALINSAIFIGFLPSGGVLRLAIIGLLNASGLMLLIFFFKMAKNSFDTSVYFKSVFIVLILWGGFTSLRGLSPNPKDLITLFGHLEMGWAWLTPFAVIFGFNIFNWLSIYNFSAKVLLSASLLGVIGILINNEIFIFGVLELMAFLPIMMLLYSQQTKNNQKIIIVAFVSYLALSFFASQRANFIFILIIVIFFIIEMYRRAATKFRKILISHIIILSSLFLAYQMTTIVSSISSDKEASTDTRTFLFEELFGDLSPMDELVGRGSLGTYYSPYFGLLEELGLPGDSSTRSVSEVAYLQMILKGGYITIALYLLLLLPAAYLGIFKSNNIVARMSGYYIITYLILWTVTYHPTYSARMLLLWMAAGTAMSSTARSIRDVDLIAAIAHRSKLRL